MEQRNGIVCLDPDQSFWAPRKFAWGVWRDAESGLWCVGTAGQGTLTAYVCTYTFADGQRHLHGMLTVANGANTVVDLPPIKYAYDGPTVANRMERAWVEAQANGLA